MYDELVKRLRRCEQFQCRECEYEQVMGCRAKLNAEAADAIEELADTNVGKWIPVTERLPGSGVPTLICGDGNVVEQGFFDDEYGYWYDWGGNRTFVHHWMPLPQPPKEET